MKKNLPIAFLLIFLITGLFLAVFCNNNFVQATEIGGIISSNTTWLKVNSPYTLTGAVGITNGTVLTIEPGVTVNLLNNYIQINGTLNAKGITTDPIFFNGLGDAKISFTQSSSDWNEQASSGSIIENTVFQTVTLQVDGCSPKISSNYFGLSSVYVIQSNSSIVNNIFIDNPGVPSALSLRASNATVSGNLISSSFNAIIISGEIPDPGDSGNNFPLIVNNLVLNSGNAIKISSLGSYVPATATIRNNTFFNNSNGISFEMMGGPTPAAVIEYNNIYNNTYNFNLYTALEPLQTNVTASQNWFGTTDQLKISQSMYDFNKDFVCGNVTFVPFLTQPNTQAPIFIFASVGSNGQIAPNGYIRINYSGDQVFTVTPNSGYHVADVIVNGTSVGAVTSYIATNVQGLTSISATFAADPVPTPTPTTSSPSPTPSATPTPSPTSVIPEYSSILALTFLIIVSTALLLSKRIPKNERSFKLG